VDHKPQESPKNDSLLDRRLKPGRSGGDVQHNFVLRSLQPLGCLAHVHKVRGRDGVMGVRIQGGGSFTGPAGQRVQPDRQTKCASQPYAFEIHPLRPQRIGREGDRKDKSHSEKEAHLDRQLYVQSLSV
jgi:hypothetical protein